MRILKSPSVFIAAHGRIPFWIRKMKLPIFDRQSGREKGAQKEGGKEAGGYSKQESTLGITICF
jgi:hypothetical protein